jgi:hypothetical protein
VFSKRLRVVEFTTDAAVQRRAGIVTIEFNPEISGPTIREFKDPNFKRAKARERDCTRAVMLARRKPKTNVGATKPIHDVSVRC